jgi:hypothetical protein
MRKFAVGAIKINTMQFRIYFFFLSILSALHTQAQSIKWAEDIAPILYKNCATCHNPNGVAPFSLISYTDAYQNRYGIESAVMSKSMPPWPPNAAYRHFANERILSTQEIDAISAWVSGGAPIGDITKAPTPPVFSPNGEISIPDLVLTMPTYTVNTTTDLYRCFVIPSQLLQDRFITEMEVLPGNRSVVHHVLVFQDTTNLPIQLDAAQPGPGYTNYGGTGSQASQLIMGWVPGQGAIKYPTGFAQRMKRNANVVLQVHYPGGLQNQVDSTKLRLKFAPTNTTGLRELTVSPILAHVAPILQNGPLFIPANQVKTFRQQVTIPANATVMSVAPHMHLIGRKTRVWAEPLIGDTIRMIDIPDWDFNWQGSYTFQKMLRVPAFSRLIAEATYDNTTNNPYNPNNPPQNVKLGEGTADEMMLTYFTFTEYRPGDENIVLDSSILVTNIGPDPQKLLYTRVMCSPNPVSDKMQIQFDLPETLPVNLDIFREDGVRVRSLLVQENTANGHFQGDFTISDLAPGSYYLRLSARHLYGVTRFIKVE